MKTIRYPEGNVILRNLKRDIPVVSRGSGPYLFDQEGKRYIDACGGAYVASVGHANEEVIHRITEQLRKVSYVNGTQFTSEPTESLARKLAELGKPIGLDRCLFLNSGSEAVEAAVKLARQISVEKGKPNKYKIISRTPSYHGNTLFALSLSGRPHYKKFYAPYLQEAVQIPAPYEYRSEVDSYSEKGGAYYSAKLEEAILKTGPENVAAFIFEPIIGSSAGGSVPPPDYFKHVQEICRRHDILMIADEVLCGAGRTGRFFASEHFGFEPDILVLGKGIGGGYTALSVVMTRSELIDLIQKSTGAVIHDQTYLHAPFMTAAGLAVLEQFEKHSLVKNAANVGEYLLGQLRSKLENHENIGFITGRGLLIGLEIVENKVSKKPFDRAQKKAETFALHCFKNGLIVWPSYGQTPGSQGDLIQLAPPLNLTKAQADEITTLLVNNISSYFQG